MSLKRLALVSGVLLLVFAFIFFVIDLYDKTQVEKINNGLDTRLANFDYAKSIALDSINILTIKNQEEYDSAKQRYKKIMTEDLWNEYFPSNKYEGGEKNLTIRVKNISGEIINDDHFIFNIEAILTNDGVENSVRFLVYVKNGLVYKIQSLGVVDSNS